MFQMKRKSQKMKNWQTNLQKMWRYRSNVRSDAARLEKMRKKNGECKKAKGDIQRQAIQSGNTKLEKKDQDAKKYLDEKIQRKKENKEQKN